MLMAVRPLGWSNSSPICAVPCPSFKFGVAPSLTFRDRVSATPQPYKPGMPDVKIGKKEESDLDKGNMVQEKIQVGRQGRAIAVQDVHAPPEYVWDRILDFNNYKNMAPKVQDCYNYYTERMRNGTEIIKTRLRLNVFGVKFDNYIYHTHFPAENTVTWTLDYSKRSDLDDSVGLWHVTPHPKASAEKGDWSRVYYSVSLRVPSWVPGLVISYLQKKAIREANTWVKREAEAQYNGDLKAGRPLLAHCRRVGDTGGGGFQLGGGAGLGGFFGKKAEEPVMEVQELPEEEDEEGGSLILGTARRLVGFGAGYAACWFIHVRGHEKASAASA
ncbi:unnamed protein product [Chrysoparadoxa australica]